MPGSGREIHAVKNRGVLASVERRGPTLQVYVVGIRYRTPLAGGTEECGVVVDRFADNVGRLEEIAAPRLILSRNHHAIVNRVSNVLACGHTREKWVREGLHVGRLVSAQSRVIDRHRRLVLIEEQPEFVAGAALVIYFYRDRKS